MRYVALGDSYTIGTSVNDGERWPNQLVARLADTDVELAGNLATLTAELNAARPPIHAPLLPSGTGD